VARSHTIRVWRNDAEIAIVAPLAVRLAMNGESQATVTLVPSDDDPLVLSDDDRWDVVLEHEAPGGALVRTYLMRGARARAGGYALEFRPPQAQSLGTYRTDRTVVLTDRHAAFRDRAPGETVTHEKTDTWVELQYVAREMGFTTALTSCDVVPVERIDYTRDGGFWDALEPYFAPFEPVVMVDPSSGVLFVFDTSRLHLDADRADRPLGLADYNPASVSVSLLPVVTQAKVIWQDFEGGSDDESELVRPIFRTEDDVFETDDGHLARVWLTYADMRENDEDGPDADEVTRTVIFEQGQSRAIDGRPILEEVSTHTYEGDFSRIRKVVRAVSAEVDLPFTGTDFGLVDTITETYTYTADPLVPGRRFLSKTVTKRTGLVVFTIASGIEDPTEIERIKRRTATPVREASQAFTVDTGSDTAQGWEDGAAISTKIEHRKRLPGSRQVVITGTETDDLRERTIALTPRVENGDTALDPGGKARFEYVGEAGRRARTVDATKIGRDLGLEIARRLVNRTAPRLVVRLTLTRPDYVRYRLGRLVRLDTDAPHDLAGLYLCTSVDLDGQAPTATRANVEQTLELLRLDEGAV
jgi:hypothetical protein